MQLNLLPNAPSAIAMVNHVAAKIETVAAAVKDTPNLSMSPNQINRIYEFSKDPPITVLKFTNSVTHEVELQIPSEASIKIYKETQKFIADQAKRIESVNIIV